jgi:hypothetical protein
MLDDAEISKASRWLGPMLDDLAAEIGRLRGRMTRARA